MRISYGSMAHWGFEIGYNPDYKDISIGIIHWYIAIGLK